MPKVSIIVPNYNHAKYLPQRLNSIFNQTFHDYEVILLDDCSTDNSVEILACFAKDPRVSYFIVNSKNSGSTFKQLKKGIDLSRGEYIWIAESDDWAENEFLQKTLSIGSVDIGIIYTQSIIVNEKDERLYINTKYTDYLDPEKWETDFTGDGIDSINRFFIYRNVIPNMSAVLMQRIDLTEIIINENLKYLGDWFIYCQLLLKKKIYFISEPLNYYRQHSDTVRTRAMVNGLREKEYFFLLGFLKKHRAVSKEGLRKQIFINLKSWIKKGMKINVLMHFKIAWHFFRFLV